jgi:cytochrome P450
MFSALGRAEHARYRKLVNRYFTRNHVRTLEPDIEHTAHEIIDRMVRAGGPADLCTDFARPLVATVFGRVLGLPVDDRVRYHRWTATVLSPDSAPAGKQEAFAGIHHGLTELIRVRRDGRTDDVLGDLIHGGHGLSDEEILNIALLLLVTGLETTVHMIGLSFFALLEHPEQLAAVRDDPSTGAGAVEELLRYLSIVHFGLTRVAHDDIEIGDLRMRPGETVVAQLAVANRDPRAFTDPDRLDVRRAEASHLAFGHGAHLCLGAHLARAELQISLRTLLARLPGLRLAVDAGQIETTPELPLYSARSLPVTWDL